jgi:hypothetical protein
MLITAEAAAKLKASKEAAAEAAAAAARSKGVRMLKAAYRATKKAIKFKDPPRPPAALFKLGPSHLPELGHCV